MWSGSNGLGVVDDSWPAVETDDSRKRGFDARDAALAFERLHEGGLFAYLVGASTGLGDDVEVEAVLAEDVLAEETFCVGIGYGLFDDLEEIAVFAAKIDEAHLCSDGETCNHSAFDNRVRVVQEDDVILARARLGFVTVDENVLGFLGGLGDEGPLHARGEACSAAAAKAGSFHLADDPIGSFFDGELYGLVAIELDVLVDVGCALAEAAGENANFIRM